MWTLTGIAVTENCKGHFVMILSSGKDFLASHQLLCDGDIYRYTVKKHASISWCSCRELAEILEPFFYVMFSLIIGNEMQKAALHITTRHPI